MPGQIRAAKLTPAACLQQLPEPNVIVTDTETHDEMRRVELGRSILAITEIDHVREIGLIRAVLTTLGRGEAETHG
jgi:hypothetical protein